MALYPEESLKSKKQLIEEYAHRMGIRIAFEEDFKLDKNMIEVLWSDGYMWRFTVSIDPMVKNENTILCNYRLNHTIQTPTSPSFET